MFSQHLLEASENAMKHLLTIALEYQQLLKELPPDVAYEPSRRDQRREAIRKKFNSTDSQSYQQESG